MSSFLFLAESILCMLKVLEWLLGGIAQANLKFTEALPLAS